VKPTVWEMSWPASVFRRCARRSGGEDIGGDSNGTCGRENNGSSSDVSCDGAVATTSVGEGVHAAGLAEMSGGVRGSL
jgi:hypothetical protein